MSKEYEFLTIECPVELQSVWSQGASQRGILNAYYKGAMFRTPEGQEQWFSAEQVFNGLKQTDIDSRPALKSELLKALFAVMRADLERAGETRAARTTRAEWRFLCAEEGIPLPEDMKPLLEEPPVAEIGRLAEGANIPELAVA